MASTSALTTTARADANAAAAKATIDLLRVADMDDETKDASLAAVDACGRLARALAVSRSLSGSTLWLDAYALSREERVRN